MNNLNLQNDTDLVPVGHSYGAVVLAKAEALGLEADRVMYVAPAGYGEDFESLQDFPATGDKPHYVVQARNDFIVGSSQGLMGFGVGHGDEDPLNVPGIVRLETGYQDANNPESGTIEDTGPEESHSAVFWEDSTSIGNITGVVTGDTVTLYHPYEIESNVKSVTVDPDSGPAHTPEWVSSLDGEPVQ